MEYSWPLLAVFLVLALVFGFRLVITSSWAAGVSKLLRPARSPVMIAEERIVLDARHSLHLVRVGGRRLVLALHAQGVSVVETLDGGSA